MNIIYVDASERFLQRLKGVTDPELKRKIIGEEFITVFEEEAHKIGKVDFLAQGTLYPDVIESALSGSASAKIKTHHNVGGLPMRCAWWDWSWVYPKRWSGDNPSPVQVWLSVLLAK